MWSTMGNICGCHSLFGRSVPSGAACIVLPVKMTQPMPAPSLSQRQEEERGRKAREEKDKHLYTVIKAARAQDLQEQIGNTLFWDLVDFEQVRPPCAVPGTASNRPRLICCNTGCRGG